MASSRSSRDRTKAKDASAADKKKKRGGKSDSSSGSSSSGSSKGSRSSSSSSSSSSGSSSRSRSSSSSSSRGRGARGSGKDKEKKPAAAAAAPPPPAAETKKEKPKADKASRSPSPRRRKRTPTPPPRPTKIHVGRLTRNVNEEHVKEIFSVYGTIKNIDMPKDPLHRHLYKGFAYVEFENPDEADKAMKHMDGGQIDGQEVSCAPILAQIPKKSRLLSGRSPPRRGGAPGRYARSPPRYAGRRRSPPRGRGGRSPPAPRRQRSSSPSHSSPSIVAERLTSHRRGLSSRVRRLTRIFSLSPLLFDFAPSINGDLMALLGETELAASSPHYPAALSVKQRRLIAAVDRVLKHFDSALKGSSPSLSVPKPSKLRDLMAKFRRLPEPLTRASLKDVVSDCHLSREILRRILSDDEDVDGRRVSASDVSDSELTVVVYLVLAVLCRVLLDAESLESTLESVNAKYSNACRELCDKGNRVCYLVIGGDDEEDAQDLSRAANFYTAAAAACPFDPRPYLNRGVVYFKRGDFDLAFTDGLRAHLLNPRRKSANYLMAECLYQMGEINAARTLNRQSVVVKNAAASHDGDSTIGRSSNPLNGETNDEADNDAVMARQYDRWRAVERTAKDRLERILNTASYDYLSRRDPLAAIDAYGRVDDLVEEFGHAALDLLDIDLAVLDYCRSLAYVASGIPYYINCAIEKMERIIDNPTLQFPLAFLVLAKAFRKLRIFSTAREWAKRGVETLRRGVVMTGGRHCWPGTSVLMEESRSDKMEEAFLGIIESCERQSSSSHSNSVSHRDSPGPTFTFTL